MDDLNATPIDKLPAPVMQSRSEMPKVEPPTYQEMLRTIDSARQSDGQNFAPPANGVGGRGFDMQPPPPPVAGPDPRLAHFGGGDGGMGGGGGGGGGLDPRVYDAYNDPRYGHGDYVDREPYPPARPRTPTLPPSASAPSASRRRCHDAPPRVVPPLHRRLWSRHKRVILVALAILGVLWFGLPKLRTMPRFVNEFHQLNTLGAIAAAMLGAAAFALADSFVPS